MGLDTDVFYVNKWDIREFSIGCEVVNRRENFVCNLVTVYGYAYEEKKQDLIDELHNICLEIKNPFIIRGGGLTWLGL
jgi:hypothetical protein